MSLPFDQMSAGADVETEEAILLVLVWDMSVPEAQVVDSRAFWLRAPRAKHLVVLHRGVSETLDTHETPNARTLIARTPQVGPKSGALSTYPHSSALSPLARRPSLRSLDARDLSLLFSKPKPKPSALDS